MRIFFRRAEKNYIFIHFLYPYICTLIPAFPHFETKFFHGFYVVAIPSTIERKIRFGAISRGIGSRERINMISGRRRET